LTSKPFTTKAFGRLEYLQISAKKIGCTECINARSIFIQDIHAAQTKQDIHAAQTKQDIHAAQTKQDMLMKMSKRTSWTLGCQILLGATYQKGKKMQNVHKIYQMTTKYSKYPQNIPSGHKIYQHCPFRGTSK
jgi:hypothetical protein